ncbi:hypothetical protein N1031_19920 [Herbiconiux moechotypicola]|uniref:Uncharacterized protein n=1 Tax=Herbiconiux moechotypicola TaxID=637393 RepID=A0ABN3E767_9MICO|nr:hypothetical protein [Herbiconiux moechotypicola]MCS5732028.1 hypothetical protein [Herbiconiux moechotypicola]
MPRLPFRRAPRIRRSLAGVGTRIVAGVAIAAVVVGGAVVLDAPEPAQAKGDLPRWADTLNNTVGTATELFGGKAIAKDFDLAMNLFGPIISSLFGDSHSGPGIQDVLDKLEELDDIENKLDVMQSELVDIKQSILDVDLSVLQGTCVTQTVTLPDYLTDLKTAQRAYEEVLHELAEARTDSTRAIDLTRAINSFIVATMGSADHVDASTSIMAQRIGNVHEHLVTSGGRPGAIQSCGTAYFEQWKLQQTSAAARGATTETQRGIWLDDRQYYEPLQQMVQFWQTAEAHGLFFLQQASLMQAAIQYTVADGRALAPSESASVCKSAIDNRAGNARFVCTTSLTFANTFHVMLVEEWKQVGLPISNDNVVMSLGTDLTGVTDNGAATTSLVWARKPGNVSAPWVQSTWNAAASAVSYDGLSGFLPANSAQFGALQSQYVTSHTNVIPFVQTPVQKLDGSTDATWRTAGVKPFAPFDLLTLMRENVAPGETTGAFDTTGVDMVWLPNETATRYIRAWWYNVDRKLYGATGNLAFAPSMATGWQDKNADYHWFTENGISVRCMVAPVDGLLCGEETIASWFIARQSADWSNQGGVMKVRPSSPVLGDFEGNANKNVRCERWREASMIYPTGCEWTFDRGVTKAPQWLAAWTLKDGTTIDAPSAAHTLWPVTAVPAECGKTSWGVPTRCGASMDAWLKANIPNPAAPGPQPTAAPVVTPWVFGPSSGICSLPTWAPNSAEEGVAITTSDVTWTGWVPGRGGITATAPQTTVFEPSQIALDLGLWAPDGGIPEPLVTEVYLTCSMDAKYADLATVSTVTSAVTTARYNGMTFDLVRVGAEEPAEPAPSPMPSPSQPSPAPAPTGTEPTDAAGGPSTLAATGIGSVSTGLWAAGAVVLAGLVLALVAALRSRRTARARR